MEPEGSLLCSQELATVPYPELHASSSCLPACLPAFLPSHLPAHISACLPAYVEESP